MPVILNRSKALTPKPMKEIRYKNVEKKALQMSKQIAREFGEQSKKKKIKTIIYR